MLIVNGFTRISGPAEVYASGRVGFDYEEDHGVPYISDIHFTGLQTEFRPGVEWTSNDSPGHGSSRATHETEIFAGNTFDFVYIHGTAIRAAGHPSSRPESTPLSTTCQKPASSTSYSASRKKSP